MPQPDEFNPDLSFLTLPNPQANAQPPTADSFQVVTGAISEIGGMVGPHIAIASGGAVDGLQVLLTAGANTLTASLTGSVSVVASGTYTPTRSAEVNMDGSVTLSEAQYMRVRNTVTVSGRFTADPTLTATPTSFEMSLPIASNIGAIEDVAGVAFCGSIAGMGAGIVGVVANDTAKCEWISSDIASQVWSYQFSYQIL